MTIQFMCFSFYRNLSNELGYPPWVFILNSLRSVSAEERTKIENYREMFGKCYESRIGDYLLFVMAFSRKELIKIGKNIDVCKVYQMEFDEDSEVFGLKKH